MSNILARWWQQALTKTKEDSHLLQIHACLSARPLDAMSEAKGKDDPLADSWQSRGCARARLTHSWCIWICFLKTGRKNQSIQPQLSELIRRSVRAFNVDISRLPCCRDGKATVKWPYAFLQITEAFAANKYVFA